MRPQPMLLRIKNTRKRAHPMTEAVRWIVALIGTLYLSWLLILPGHAGKFGTWLSEQLFHMWGGGIYLLLIFLVNGLFLFFRAQKPAGRLTLALICLLSMVSVSSLLALTSRWLERVPSGGTVGQAVATALASMVGGFGTGLLCLGALALVVFMAVPVSWSKLMERALWALLNDFRNWQRARRDLAAQIAKTAPLPQVQRPPTDEDIVIVPTKTNGSAPVAIKSAVNGNKNAAGLVAMPKSPPPPPGSPYAHYRAPSMELLEKSTQSLEQAKPTPEEIAIATENLEKTLANFDLIAKVTGYAPGPVITRYELEPAPGVKISSIAALSQDLALALKAKGIRIIAPIPGKAAIGIEIPNSRPIRVSLREILESPSAASGGLLTFAIGLSADGQSTTADLQKMPHLLVAGATNSGKSVLLHSLILSILYRARPDEVKFLMIDPKRLELSFYDFIPHLFDPTKPPAQASVITLAKDATKSLQALVTVMMKRYEKFQLYGVRNIDSYNQEALKRGEPREFFVVVVIDELADLMLVQDSVEDCIQRLTQMARAVGIHMVLATQRPSVDVITGVIKANLPSRIALQVITKVDSKVILDVNGAESLQGRGDLLYLAAGAQKPERCQGAYVSEEEITRVVKHLKDQGKPDYPWLDSMAPATESDLAGYGVTALEFSQALRLVLERKRVSQDLLKSQFGSSARATNLLSLLEVKELIHKPEGTNRWEINYDRIEDYMRRHFPQALP